MSEQDTREQLEADIERYLSQAGCHEMVCGWLDRQAAITRYIERGMHDFILDRLERENDKLTAERDDLRRITEELEKRNDELLESRAYWINQVMSVYRRFYPHDGCVPANVCSMVIAKIDELEADRDELREALDACGTGTMYELWRRDHTQLKALRAALHDKTGT